MDQPRVCSEAGPRAQRGCIFSPTLSAPGRRRLRVCRGVIFVEGTGKISFFTGGKSSPTEYLRQRLYYRVMTTPDEAVAAAQPHVATAPPPGPARDPASTILASQAAGPCRRGYEAVRKIPLCAGSSQPSTLPRSEGAYKCGGSRCRHVPWDLRTDYTRELHLHGAALTEHVQIKGDGAVVSHFIPVPRPRSHQP